MWLSNASEAPGHLYCFEVDLSSLSSVRRQLDPASMEFPSVHPYRHGLPCRYVYAMAADAPRPNIPFRDVVKHDMQDASKRQVCLF